MDRVDIPEANGQPAYLADAKSSDNCVVLAHDQVATCKGRA